MSWFLGRNRAPKDRRPLIDDGRVTQHESGSVRPVLWGTQRFATTALCDPFDRVVKPKKGQKKIGKTGGDTYATVALAICVGPIDTLHQIWVDEELWWDGPIHRLPAEDSTPITVEEWGSGTLYWGTATQPVDATLGAAFLPHPSYRRLAYFVFPKAFLGQRDTVPNFEVVVSRRGILPAWFTASSVGFDSNPIAPVIESALNDVWGRGVPENWLDTASLLSVANALVAEGIGISPLITKSMTLRQLCSDIGEIVDGWFRVDGTGRLTCGLNRSIAPAGEVFREHAMLSPPEIKLGSWSDTASAVQIAFVNSSRAWLRDTPPPSGDSANYAVTRIQRRPVVEMPWVTNPATAAKLQDIAAQRRGRPYNTGRLYLRPSKSAGLAPGDLRRFSYGHQQIFDKAFRVTSVTQGAPGNPEKVVEITYDVGFLNQSFSVPPVYVPPPDNSETPVVATYQDVWVMPPLLGGSNRYPFVAVLCAQPTPMTDEFYGHQLIGVSSYAPLAPESSVGFSVRASIHASTGASGNVDVTILGIDTLLDRWEQTEYDQGRIVALFESGEVMKVSLANLLVAGRYRLNGVRGAFGTTAAAVTAAQKVWLINAEQIYKVEFRVSISTVATFKIQPSIRRRRVDLALCAALAITVDPSSVAAPPPTSLAAHGTALNTWSATNDVRVSWVPREDFGPVAVRLEMWDPAGPTQVATIDLPYGSVEYLWPYAVAVAALGGTPVTFEVRARHRGGALYGPAATITVTRI